VDTSAAESGKSKQFQKFTRMVVGRRVMLCEEASGFHHKPVGIYTVDARTGRDDQRHSWQRHRSRDSDSNISVDGANTQNLLYGMSNQVQSQATIQEVKIQTATMNAEFGSGANAVTVITKGGTNAFHGEAFVFHRNDNLDATPFFTNLIGGKLPEYKRNTFGGSFGGPIVQNKLHFFGNYEG
jgi:hypothetical protein